jgi:CRP/FNR family transcriptional regulator, cyclic AMP receptor protein
LFFVLATRFRAVKADLTLERGTVLRDIGLLMRDQRRTQTVVYAEDGTLLHISCDEVRQLCFQNLRFGDYFLQLAASRGGFMTPAGRRKPPIPQTDARSQPASC